MIKRSQRVLIILLSIFVVLLSPVFYVKADETSSDYPIRIYGDDRYATAEAIVKKGWTNSNTVVIASGVNFPDALCAGPLAKKYNAPILISSTNGLSENTLDEIEELKATKAIIIGGKGSISTNVEVQLRGMNLTDIERIGGTDRYDTSVLIAKQLNKPSKAIITSGSNYPDALSIASLASQQNIPIILSPKDKLTNSALNFINSNNIDKVYILGGEAVISDAIEHAIPNSLRLSGDDRFDTNLAILNQFTSELNFNNVYVASGNGFADALTASQLAAKSKSPVVLVSDWMSDGMYNYLRRHTSGNTSVIGIGGGNSVDTVLLETILEMYHPVDLDNVSLSEDTADSDGYNSGCWVENDKNELSIGGKDYLDEYFTRTRKRGNILCSLLNNVSKANYSIDLNNDFTRMTAIAGIDDNSTQKQNAKIELQILADGYSLFDQELKWGDAPVNIDVNLKGYEKLLIKITNTGGSTFLFPDQMDILGVKFYKN